MAFVPGVSIKHKSDSMGYFFVGRRCSCVANPSSPIEVLLSAEFVSLLAVSSLSLAINIVIVSVVGRTPLSWCSLPSNALISVDLPELNSPANTTVKRDKGVVVVDVLCSLFCSFVISASKLIDSK